MDRRETLKTLLIGTVAGGTLATGVSACKSAPEAIETPPEKVEGLYGRTPPEKARDEALMSATFFSEHELATIAVLCDIILPDDEISVSATQVEVPDFIEFIAKDMPRHQLPLRGGIMWLDHECTSRFGQQFINCSEIQKMEIVDQIAWQDHRKKYPYLNQGINFFDLVRNLTLTGFYTTKIGVETLGYVGNRPNIWDGVPDEVLKDLSVDYDEEWLAKCIDQRNREKIAQWDDEGNLIS